MKSKHSYTKKIVRWILKTLKLLGKHTEKKFLKTVHRMFNNPEENLRTYNEMEGKWCDHNVVQKKMRRHEWLVGEVVVTP